MWVFISKPIPISRPAISLLSIELRADDCNGDKRETNPKEGSGAPLFGEGNLGGACVELRIPL